MKRNLLVILFTVFLSPALFAQTAVDFTATDCSGTSHHLFSELNSGKVIVLCWVMPCPTCVGPSLTTYNVVASYQTTYPNRVYMYICDDYADTDCSSLDSWKGWSNLNDATTFSDLAISMYDYGATGMPKIVVLGGINHTVYYNADNTVNATALQAGINAALLSIGIDEATNLDFSLNMFPNPAVDITEINFCLEKSSPVDLELIDLEGKLVQNIHSGKLAAGENKIQLDVSSFPTGTYSVKFTAADKSRFVSLIVSH